MRNDLKVSASIDINAPLQKVWEGLTKPEIIKEYLFGTETKTDWKVGSPVLFQGEYNGQKYCDKGIVLEANENELLSYSYWSSFSGLEDRPENYSIITLSLKKHGDNKTSFTWTQSGFASEQGYEHSRNGMDEFLSKIKQVIESK